MVDDVFGIGKAAEVALDLVKEPIRTMCGPWWNEVAGAWGDTTRHWRDMKRLDRAIEAAKKIQAKGLSPKQVDPQILFPILDAASITEDPNLKDKWTNLLARASTESQTTVLPAFSRILSELSPLEGALLDHLCREPDDTEDGEGFGEWRHIPVEITEAIDELEKEQVVPHGAALYEANFVRLGLIQKSSGSLSEEDVRKVVEDMEEAKTTRNRYTLFMSAPGLLGRDREYYFFTPLGTAFIDACRPL